MTTKGNIILTSNTDTTSDETEWDDKTSITTWDRTTTVKEGASPGQYIYEQNPDFRAWQNQPQIAKDLYSLHEYMSTTTIDPPLIEVILEKGNVPPGALDVTPLILWKKKKQGGVEFRDDPNTSPQGRKVYLAKYNPVYTKKATGMLPRVKFSDRVPLEKVSQRDRNLCRNISLWTPFDWNDLTTARAILKAVGLKKRREFKAFVREAEKAGEHILLAAARESSMITMMKDSI